MLKKLLKYDLKNIFKLLANFLKYRVLIYKMAVRINIWTLTMELPKNKTYIIRKGIIWGARFEKET